MMNQVEDIQLQLHQLRLDKENYEDCCYAFKNEWVNEGDAFEDDLRKLSNHHETCDQMKDKPLTHLIENVQDQVRKAQEVTGELLHTVDTEFSTYCYNYEEKEDELRRALNRLEWL